MGGSLDCCCVSNVGLRNEPVGKKRKKVTRYGLSSDTPCAQNCTCSGDSVDCSDLGLTATPLDLPVRTVSLNLSHNKLTAISPEVFASLPNLRELRLDHNELTSVPDLGQAAPKIVSLYLHHNKIRSIDGRRTEELVSVETLDLSNNDITELRGQCFPAGLQIRNLHLSNNKISVLELGALDHLGSTLQVLRLSRNRISQIPVKAFQLPRLTQLELNRNRIRQVEGLTFQGLSSLEVLRLQRNSISKLTDGAFFDLAKMKVLHLDYNSLTEVNSGSLYGLTSLQQLFLSNNSIARINPDGWKFCQKLRELNLSYNNLTRLDEGSLAVLGDLHTLRLGHNSISHINEGAFRGLKALRILELDHNDISGTIEDTNGAFSGLDSLIKLTLFGNKIKSVAKKAFSGLETLEHLNLGENAIRSIQPDAFSKMRNLKSLLIQSNSLRCDCQLHWLPDWLVARSLQAGINATCAHPESLKGKSIFEVPSSSFVCDDLPKPQITVQPENTVTVLGSEVRLTCTAASSSSSPMTFAWRKDQELLRNAEMENYAHVRAHHQGATPDLPGAGGGGVMEYTTILHLRHVTFAHEGRYQCIITNHFGSTYSSKARVIVNVLPSFVKTPRDSTIRTGHTARLECAAEGHPAPQIAWQKDGGTDFPAARERRMHVMPDDDVFFIMDVKPEDMGVYSCTAKNTAGTVSANATLTVLETPHLAQDLEDRSVAVGDTVALQCKALGSPPPRITWLRHDQPLRPSDRHHFTPGNQLLVIGSASLEDAGRYTCLMSNTLGTERAHSQLVVTQRRSTCTATTGPSTVTIGIIVIAVVTSIVVTSLVWVCIIYQTRKKSEDCSVTNTDETIVHPDVSSYLSSQGTLSERQDVCIRVEAGGGPQPNGHVVDTTGFDGAVLCTDCMENGNSYSKDPDYLAHGFGPAAGMEYQQQLIPPPYSYCHPREQHDPGSHTTPLCNGTPNRIRKNSEGSALPKNHNTTLNQYDRKAVSRAGQTKASSPSQEDSFHKPVKLAGLTSHGCTDTDCEPELRQTLLSNGHALRASQNESASLRRASD
ncbi:leucine-rich repeats and immunoglobulin-like domains protein 1 isoform X3 [Archocentrus centrarchus]|uniref:leucine-rich repeats and immunoglobulin-like domains protein 1 isoform X3 n=1 Tax=Archocentrus centrarchus TaxID=63155 RepID=UPI0011E9BC1D|nr:leucine-rich repeats and immunoglobulin-like domains protein 1 isoform X3 [Archocentrus centrarchus]